MTVETKTEVGTPPAAPAVKVDPRQRADTVVVTQENFNEHVDKILAKPAEDEPDVNDVDAVAAADLKKLDAEKAAKKAKEAAENEEIDHPDPQKKGRLQERMGELTTKRKEAEARAEAKSKEAVAAFERAEAAERQAAELRAKYEPPKSDELGPEPQPSQFTDTTEFAKALKDWTADATRREDARKQADAANAARTKEVAESWVKRQAEAKKEMPDYDEKLAGSTAVVSDLVRDAIVESEVGPQILYHLAENPEVALKWRGLSGPQVLREVGKLEARLAKADSAPAAPAKPAAGVSKAPPPISPLNGGGSASVIRLRGSDPVPSNMTYDAWKKLRESGKIQ